ncbi:MAG: hypothetical protein GY832_15000 [Chloroflexi bacterium]|nr:hypothetical protein [Chloroflexota bacterium]
MNNKQMQLNRRQVISLLLAILVLTMSATPVFAWIDEGGEDFQAGHAMTTEHDVTGGSVDSVVTSEYPLGLFQAEGW